LCQEKDHFVQIGDRELKYFQEMIDSAWAAGVSRCVVDSRRSSGMCLQSHHTDSGGYRWCSWKKAGL